MDMTMATYVPEAVRNVDGTEDNWRLVLVDPLLTRPYSWPLWKKNMNVSFQAGMNYEPIFNQIVFR